MDAEPPTVESSDQPIDEPERQTFVVTVETTRHRRLLVQAVTWEDAKEIVEREFPAGSNFGAVAESSELEFLPDSSPDESFNEVVFIDSQDGSESHYRRP